LRSRCSRQEFGAPPADARRSTSGLPDSSANHIAILPSAALSSPIPARSRAGRGPSSVGRILFGKTDLRRLPEIAPVSGSVHVHPGFSIRFSRFGGDRRRRNPHCWFVVSDFCRRAAGFANSHPILPFCSINDASKGRPFLEINPFNRSLLPSASILRIWSGGISR